MMLYEHILDQEPIIWLNSNSPNEPSYLGVGRKRQIKVSDCEVGAFKQMKQFWNERQSWLMGYLSYDLKNDTETLSSENADFIKAPSLWFIEPKCMFIQQGGKWTTVCDDLHLGPPFAEWLNTHSQNGTSNSIELKARINKEQYISDLHKVLGHIKRGDIYELNYCQEFFAEQVSIDPLTAYHRLNHLTRTPLSSFISLDEFYLLCGSPERFISKKGNIVRSQPIKGTVKRGKTPKEDNDLKERLVNDPKERAENIMITDLVRNDLSQYATKGSVKVEELCGVYTFETVHQLISTVTAEMKPGTHWVDIIKKAFPMGSMTGAPKIRAMELIEKYEHSKRGIYSGAVGYISPEGNFDFNVVIRSLIYNSESQYLSAFVGGAITSQSIPQNEYNECLLKAEALKKSLK